MIMLDNIYQMFFVPVLNFWNSLTSLQFSVFGYSVDFGHLMVSIVILTFFLSVVIKR